MNRNDRNNTENNENSGEWISEPALFTTTQTTIPLLTALMFSLALAMIGFAISKDFLSHPLEFWSLDTKSVAFFMLGLSALSFIFAAEGCVKSHAWDYYAISDERRRFYNLSNEKDYIEFCLNKGQFWHTNTAWAYNIGSNLILLGIVFLFWPTPTARPVAIIIICYILIKNIIMLLYHFYRQKFDQAFINFYKTKQTR